jgi:hypothetical protein
LRWGSHKLFPWADLEPLSSQVAGIISMSHYAPKKFFLKENLLNPFLSYPSHSNWYSQVCTCSKEDPEEKTELVQLDPFDLWSIVHAASLHSLNISYVILGPQCKMEWVAFYSKNVKKFKPAEHYNKSVPSSTGPCNWLHKPCTQKASQALTTYCTFVE